MERQRKMYGLTGKRTLVVTKCWPMETRLPCGDQWKSNKSVKFWRWPITRCFIKRNRGELIIDLSINFRLNSEHRSSLQADLYSVNIVTNPFCTCGPYIENADHFFFDCSHFDNQRTHLMASLSNVVNITLDLLLYGNEYLTPHMSHIILLAVLRYIKESWRFSMWDENIQNLCRNWIELNHSQDFWSCNRFHTCRLFC